MLLFMSPYFNNYYNIQSIFVTFFFGFLNYDNNVIINVWDNLIYYYILIFHSKVLFLYFLTFKAGTSLLKT
jgi:hypothetical protein